MIADHNFLRESALSPAAYSGKLSRVLRAVIYTPTFCWDQRALDSSACEAALPRVGNNSGSMRMAVASVALAVAPLEIRGIVVIHLSPSAIETTEAVAGFESQQLPLRSTARLLPSRDPIPPAMLGTP